jgi:hypothetical protein
MEQNMFLLNCYYSFKDYFICWGFSLIFSLFGVGSSAYVITKMHSRFQAREKEEEPLYDFFLHVIGENYVLIHVLG